MRDVPEGISRNHRMNATHAAFGIDTNWTERNSANDNRVTFNRDLRCETIDARVGVRDRHFRGGLCLDYFRGFFVPRHRVHVGGRLFIIRRFAFFERDVVSNDITHSAVINNNAVLDGITHFIAALKRDRGLFGSGERLVRHLRFGQYRTTGG